VYGVDIGIQIEIGIDDKGGNSTPIPIAISTGRMQSKLELLGGVRRFLIVSPVSGILNAVNLLFSVSSGRLASISGVARRHPPTSGFLSMGLYHVKRNTRVGI